MCAKGCKVLQMSSPLNQEKDVTAEQIDEAEVYWIKSVQKTAFGREILYLIGKQHTNLPASISQFGLYVDVNSILECRG